MNFQFPTQPTLWWKQPGWWCRADVLSRGWLFATLWTVACQVPLSMEFSRQEYWSELPFPSPPSPWWCRGCCNSVLPEAARLEGVIVLVWCKQVTEQRISACSENQRQWSEMHHCPRTGSQVSGWALWPCKDIGQWIFHPKALLRAACV